MDEIPKIILQNPYRILGVYTNSRRQEIIANKSRATAFLKVGRAVDYPLDLKGLLPPLTRTLESLNEAEAHLAIAKEQIRYAQFWFINTNTPIDNIAFNHLLAGNMEGAKEMWSKQESVSSLQNRLICYLIENKPWLAIRTAEKLYEKFGDNYITRIDANSTLQMTPIELMHQFIDSLGEEINMQTLLGYEMEKDTKAYISSQAVSPLINKISSEVEKTKKVDHKDPQARIEAARKLVIATKEPFTQLKSILNNKDPQFTMIADKLGLEILQCGIDYFNNSDDDDAPHTAMKMQKYAQSVVVGTLATQRCEENVNILQKIIDELPPTEAFIYDKYIDRSLSRFINKITDKTYIALQRMRWLKEHLTNCGPYISSIKEICGTNHPYYIRKSTQIVDFTLSHIIDIVNVQLDRIKRHSEYGISVPRSSIDDLCDIIIAAWQLILMMDKFDMDLIFKQERYLQNRGILKNILNQARVNVGKPEPIDMRSERQMLFDIKSLSDCEHFLAIFPNSKHKDAVEEKREKIRFDTCLTNSDCDALLRDYPQRKNEIEELREKLFFEECTTFKDCNFYLRKYPQGKYKHQVEEILDKILLKELDNCASVEEYETFINTYPNCKFVNEAKDRLEEFIRSRRRKKITSTIIWSLVSICILGGIGYLIWDSLHKEQLEKQAAKQAEYDLYNNIVNKGDSLSCARFITSYPNSKFIGEVNKVLEEYEYHHLTTIDDCLDYISNHPHSVFVPSVDSIISERAKILEKTILDNSADYDLDKMWEFISKYSGSNNKSLQSAVTVINDRFNQIKALQHEKAEKERQDSIRKEEEARKREEYEKYGTDANAWKTATANNTISGYKDYLKRYPRGKFVDVANKKIIDLEVQAVINSGDYGHLPSSQKVSYGTGRTSTIRIKSRCDQTITIMYSGVKSIKFVLAPYESRSVVLPSSTYKVVATSPGVRSFYGTENLTGGDYESEYYIERRRY